MVQGRTKTVLHRQVPAGEENLIVVTGTHEPIVSKEIFDAVQKYRAEVAEESKKHPVIPYTPNILRGVSSVETAGEACIGSANNAMVHIASTA